MKGDWATPIDLRGMKYTVRRHEAVLRTVPILQVKKAPVIARNGYHVRSELRDRVLAAMKKGKWYTRAQMREAFDIDHATADGLIQRMTRDVEITRKKDALGLLLFGAAE